MKKASAARSAQDNRANQLNPDHPAYHRSRGTAPDEARYLAAHSPLALDNLANQLNPNNPAYKAARDKCKLPSLTTLPSRPSSAKRK